MSHQRAELNASVLRFILIYALELYNHKGTRCHYAVIELHMCVILTNATLLQVLSADYGATVLCHTKCDTGLCMERNLGCKFKQRDRPLYMDVEFNFLRQQFCSFVGQ